MATWELEAWDTEQRDARVRRYSRDAQLADMWVEIPKIQFSDSGHGVVFQARLHEPGRKRGPNVRDEPTARYIEAELAKIRKKRGSNDNATGGM